MYMLTDRRKTKAGQSFPDTAVIEVRGTTLKYVSRGGLKLEKAMQNFDVTLEEQDMYGCRFINGWIH